MEVLYKYVDVLVSYFNTSPQIITAMAAVAITLLLFILFRGHSVRKIFKLPITCIFLGSDLGGNKNPYYINKREVNGAPDAVFFDWLRLTFVVGEYKSRSYNNKIKWRENFQVILYIGLLPPWFFPRCKGYIAYGCGNVVKIHYTSRVFRKLMKLKGELRTAKKNWKPVNNTPLQKRL